MKTEQEYTKLLPCPFCGGAAKAYNRINVNAVECQRCGAQVRQSEIGMGDAAALWNRRSAQAIGYLTRDEEGSPAMMFFDLKEARLYCNPEEEPETLVLARPPLDRQDSVRLDTEGFGNPGEAIDCAGHVKGKRSE